MALVKLCNTVNRIGVSLFTHKLFVKVINQLESKRKKKILHYPNIVWKSILYKTYADINFWEISRADHVSLVYAFSEALFCLKKKIEYVHIIHCKENVVYLSQNNSFSIPSVLLFFLCCVNLVDLFPHWLKVKLYVFVWYFSKQGILCWCKLYINSILNNGNGKNIVSHFSW